MSERTQQRRTAGMGLRVRDVLNELDDLDTREVEAVLRAALELNALYSYPNLKDLVKS